MLKLMENSPTSALPPGCTGNISITVIAHLGRMDGPGCWLPHIIAYSWALGLSGYWAYSLVIRCQSDVAVLLWFEFYLFDFVVTVLCFLFFEFCFCYSLLSHHHTPCLFLNYPTPGHFYALTFPFWSLYSLFLISPAVAASKLTECFCHAVCLKPWFYCCHTKLNLTWLLGCYLQFISPSAALVKRTLSRYFFIIFQIIFFTVYNNPLKA